MSRVAVTGAAGPVGRRVVERLLADPEVSQVVTIDREPLPGGTGATDERLVAHRAHLREADLVALLRGCDVVCHLAGSDPLEGTDPDHDLHASARLWDAVAEVGAGHVVLRTSATVYGAWPDNPVPLTEAAPLRPNAESPWVLVRRQLEEQAEDFATAHPDVVVTILRPCVTVSPDGPDELGRVLAAARLVARDAAPGTQFVHADDVADAVDTVRRARAAGAFNVAPHGALEADMVRALVGGAPRLPMPEWAARRLTAVGWRYQLAPTPPGFVPFVNHPWVVANDKLVALGWAPQHTNEEAFVAGHDAAPWATISPQRRQELALGVMVVVVLGAAGAVAVGVRRFLRRSVPGATRRRLPSALSPGRWLRSVRRG